MTTFCCMCDLVRTAQSFGDDAHAVATGLHLGMTARTSQRCVVPLCRWVQSLARNPPTHTKPPISQCSQLSHTHAIELATLQRSLLNAVSHLLFPTSLFLSVLLHVFALSCSHGLKILLNAFPLSSSSTPRLFHLHRFLFMVPHVCCSYSFPRCIFIGFRHVFVTLSLPLGYASLSLSFLFLPLALLPLFCRTSLTRSRWLQPFAPQPVLPAPWRPTSCEPQRRCGLRVRHAHCLRVHASCRLGSFAKEAWKRW